MALIKKIRERTGLAIGLVAISLMLFIVGGDIMSSNSVLFSNQKNDVGEIAGEEVHIDRYRQEVEERKYNFTLQQQRNPTEAEMYSIRQQAWDLLIVKIAFQKQFEELGIEVTEEELVDMVQGNNIHPEIASAFGDPQTGEVDRDRIIEFLQMVDNQQLPPQQIAGWYLFENDLRPSRLRIKYDNLLTSSNYVTTAEAKNYYQRQNTIAEVDYMYIPYTAINDSLVNIEESELRSYLREHQDLYQIEENRSIRYVTFPIVASAIDSAQYREEMADLKEELAETQEDSLFTRRYSDAVDYFNTYSIGQLPEQLRVNVSNLSEGDVRGPYLNQDSWVLYKISGITQDTVKSVKASHILIKPDPPTDEEKAEARRQAQNILSQLRAGASFDSLARQFSDDPSASQGGDLGWFTEGQMVESFEEAVFNANEGLINRVIETTYGYHIIKVTEAATNKAFKVAAVTRNITPSDPTRNDVYQKAARFANKAGNLKKFNEVTEADSITVYSAEDILSNDRRINNIANGREIVRWMYNEAKVGDVSPIFETDDENVVAALTEVVDA
ncbi:MAG: peptidylprolyl isomerase, partial [Cyclobacteriaceae bacterium]